MVLPYNTHIDSNKEPKMNERIRELEAQCWEHDQSWTGVGQRVFNSKKFAELIIKECFDVVIKDGRFHDAKGIIRAGKSVAMEHFGVE